MGRYRSRSRSYSPRRFSRSPPRRKHYDDPRDRYRGGRPFRDRRSSGPSGLLIRNLPLDARQEDLRIPFERFGPVKDVYLPKNYYTGEPRGFGFVKFRNPEDAAEAKQQMNHKVIGGREIRIVFAEENRKTPQEMRVNARISGRSVGGRRPSPMRSPRRRYRSYSRSPSPSVHDPRYRDRGGQDDYYSPQRSASLPPHDDRNYRSRRRSESHEENGRSPSRSRSYR
uniref:Serine/arginine-rich splicing factor 10 n=1 Tax=Anthurium amnicola TaxID=1678845 RepID=A0A1D1ZAZ6_9ARAE